MNTNQYSYKAHYFYYVFFIIVMIKLYLTDNLIHQFDDPIFTFTGADNTFWIAHLLQIPHFIIRQGIWIEFLLLLVAILCIFLPKKSYLSLCFFLLYSCYYIAFDNCQAKHNHFNIGMLFFAFIFCFRKGINFYFLWNGLRWYLLFIFVSAALWKISRGAIFEYEHMSSILIDQHISLILSSETSIYKSAILYLIKKPILAKIIFITATTLELSFIIGFFTKKWDKILLLILTAFLICNYFIMQIAYFEYLIFGLLFLEKFCFQSKQNRPPIFIKQSH